MKIYTFLFPSGRINHKNEYNYMNKANKNLKKESKDVTKDR